MLQDPMHRRSFITLLGGAAAAWPLTARAQQRPAMPIIGFLHAGAPEASTSVVAAFRKGLSEAGFVEGHSVAVEYRWAHNAFERLPDLAADLVRRRVAVIVALSNAATALAAMSVTTSIPVVFAFGGDPVELGLVASFNRPGGNVTGLSMMNVELGAKQIGLLHELFPRASRFAVMVNPGNPTAAEILTRDMQAAGAVIGRHVEVIAASTAREIDAAFASLAPKRVDALSVAPDVLFTARRVQLATQATRHMMPTIGFNREIAEAGALMTYGTNVAEQYRQGGLYVGRILKGEKPADLPVMRPTSQGLCP
jgi:putative ABC transport system substrate-binding protein